jgi:hypothetical protein
LDRLAQASGRCVRICLEPEPGCALETTDDVVAFFRGPLSRTAGREEALVRRHLGACYDVCHQSVVFEDPDHVLAKLRGADVAVGKVQVSSALELQNPSSASGRAALKAFDEPRYLHQVRTRGGGSDDVPQALESLPREHPWRCHFHVPIDRDPPGPLRSTRGDLKRALRSLRGSGEAWQLEVETYTWSVLAESDRPASDEALGQGLAREVAWTLGEWSAS